MNVFLTHVEDQAERCLLSCILSDNSLLNAARAAGFDFSMISPNRLPLLEAIQTLIQQGTTVDERVLCEKLKDLGTLERLGGLGEVMGLAADWGGRNVAGFVTQIRRGYVRRSALTMLDAFTRQVERDADDVPEKAAELLHKITELSRDRKDRETWMSAVGEAIERAEMAFKGEGGARGVLTGIPVLDRATGGLPGPSLTVISGETSGGKSVLMQQIAMHIAEYSGKRCPIFSLEMEPYELAQRAISNYGPCQMGTLTRGWPLLSQGDFNNMVRGADRIKQFQLIPIYEPTATMSWIHASCVDISADGPLGCVVIDYLQLVNPENSKNQTEEQILSEMTRRAKVLSGVVSCPVIIGSQLNDDGKLRGSRAIGMHANNVLKIEHGYDKDGAITDTHLVVNKWRNGQRGQRLPVKFEGAFARFVSGEYQEPKHEN